LNSRELITVNDSGEIIRDPKAMQEHVVEMVRSAKEEILIIFSTANAFRRQEKAGAVDLVIRPAKSKNVKVRILSPFDEYVTNLIDKIKKEEKIRMEIRSIKEPLQTKVSVLIVDRRLLLSAELKDDSKETSLEAIGLATYSNSKATVLSYASIFESLWNQTELYEHTRYLYEQLKSHDKMKQEFMDIAAHELRTPIQPILGLAQLLKEQISDSTQIRFLDVILRNAERLQQLQGDMLDVTRIESGSMKIHKESFNLNDLIFHLLQDLNTHLKDDTRIKLNYRSNGDVCVIADKNRIIQVVSNLLANAITFCPEENGIIRIALHEEEQHIAIVVEDNGKGIDANDFESIFDKFYQCTNQNLKKPLGSGLGLAISKQIIEIHKGKIWAEAGRKGAKLTFTLPKTDAKTE